MQDVQKTQPKHNYAIQRVGITGLILPVYISTKDGSQQHTVANIDVFVDLDANNKGTHMSRLAIGVQKFAEHQLNQTLLLDIAEYIKEKCEAKTCQLIYHFPYFIKKIAPVSKEPGIVHCNVDFDVTKSCDLTKFQMNVETTATSLCPCSKEISDAGAHNQRSKIKVSCVPKKGQWVWIEDLVEVSELNSSCEVYSVLKRPDEKYVTERAYDRPHFVEDMVRGIFVSLKNSDKFDWFQIEVSNEESIHTHCAYAKVTSNGEV